MDKAVSPRKDSPLTLRSPYPHWMTEQVRWSDTDMVGHVNNLAFAAFCETGRSHFMRRIVDKNADPRALFLLAQMSVNFLGEVHWPATINIGTGVLAVGRSSCRLGHGLFDGERCVGTGKSVMVMIDEATRKPCRIPDWAREYFCLWTLDRQSPP